jgi:hypothetical protein
MLIILDKEFWICCPKQKKGPTLPRKSLILLELNGIEPSASRVRF